MHYRGYDIVERDRGRYRTYTLLDEDGHVVLSTQSEGRLKNAVDRHLSWEAATRDRQAAA